MTLGVAVAGVGYAVWLLFDGAGDPSLRVVGIGALASLLVAGALVLIIGIALVVFSASILVPLPGTNTVPGIAVVVIAMGLLQRDGVLVVIGTVIGTAWISTLVLAGATLASLIKAWLGL
mgnify:CR=1 FL=1